MGSSTSSCTQDVAKTIRIGEAYIGEDAEDIDELGLFKIRFLRPKVTDGVFIQFRLEITCNTLFWTVERGLGQFSKLRTELEKTFKPKPSLKSSGSRSNSIRLELPLPRKPTLFGALSNTDSGPAFPAFPEIPDKKVVLTPKQVIATRDALRSWLRASLEFMEKMPTTSRGDALTLLMHFIGVIDDPQFSNQNGQVSLNLLEGSSQTGDLLLFKTTGFLAGSVRVLTSSRYDHIGVVIRKKTPDGSTESYLLEATGDEHGVQIHRLRARLLEWYLSDAKIVYRSLRTVRDKAFHSNVDQFLEKVIGSGYGFSVVRYVRTKKDRQPSQKGKFFCSELVAALYKYIGIISSEAKCHLYMPGDFADKSQSSNRRLKLQSAILDEEVAVICRPRKTRRSSVGSTIGALRESKKKQKKEARAAGGPTDGDHLDLMVDSLSLDIDLSDLADHQFSPSLLLPTTSTEQKSEPMISRPAPLISRGTTMPILKPSEPLKLPQPLSKAHLAKNGSAPMPTHQAANSLPRIVRPIDVPNRRKGRLKLNNKRSAPVTVARASGTMGKVPPFF